MGPVECHKEAVTHRLDLTTTEAGELGAYPRIVICQQVTPTPVSKPGGPRGCVDNVSEHHGQQAAGELAATARAG